MKAYTFISQIKSQRCCSGMDLLFLIIFYTTPNEKRTERITQINEQHPLQWEGKKKKLRQKEKRE